VIPLRVNLTQVLVCLCLSVCVCGEEEEEKEEEEEPRLVPFQRESLTRTHFQLACILSPPPYHSSLSPLSTPPSQLLGAPIVVQKKEKPTDEEVSALHQVNACLLLNSRFPPQAQYKHSTNTCTHMHKRARIRYLLTQSHALTISLSHTCKYSCTNEDFLSRTHAHTRKSWTPT
jgi:hypothetical protein